MLEYSKPGNNLCEWLCRDRPMNFTAVYQKFPKGYVAFVEELPGANTQGKTLEETRANLIEAVQLILDANRQLSKESVYFVYTNRVGQFATKTKSATEV